MGRLKGPCITEYRDWVGWQLAHLSGTQSLPVDQFGPWVEAERAAGIGPASLEQLVSSASTAELRLFSVIAREQEAPSRQPG